MWNAACPMPGLASSLPVTCTCSCETMLPMAAMLSLKGRYRSCRQGTDTCCKHSRAAAGAAAQAPQPDATPPPAFPHRSRAGRRSCRP